MFSDVVVDADVVGVVDVVVCRCRCYNHRVVFIVVDAVAASAAELTT